MKLQPQLTRTLKYAARTGGTVLGIIEPERWSRSQVQFSSTARELARRALYFVRQLETGADATLLNHIRTNAGFQICSLELPPPDTWCSESLGETVRATEDRGQRDCDYFGARETFGELVKRWKTLRDLCDDQAPASAESIQRIDEEIEVFLRGSLPLDFAIRLTYARVPALLVAMRHHLGWLAGLAIAIGVCGGVEAVRSLILNQALYGVLALCTATVLPAALLFLAQAILRRRGHEPLWDLGGRLFRSLFPVPATPERWIPRHPSDRTALKIQRGLALKILLYAVLWVTIGLGYTAFIRIADGDEVALTVYMIAVALSLLVLIGSAVDFADMHSQAPLRAWILAGGFGLVVLVLWFDHRVLLLLAPVAWVIGAGWWTWRVQHKRVLPIMVSLGLIVLVAMASTNLRREEDEWPSTARKSSSDLGITEWPRGDSAGPPVVVLAASGGGSRAAVLTALTLEAIEREHTEIAAELQAISAVSGGSLTAAAYIARRLELSGADIREVPQCEAELYDRARQDFIRPTIEGVFWNRGRGRSIERAWRECPVGLGTLTVSELSRLWRDTERWPDGMVPFPIPIFNSVSLRRHSVVITPLDRSFFALPFDAEARGTRNAHDALAGEPTWVFYRSGIYTLDDLAPGYDPQLTGAVRASANFPFGFPLVEVRTDQSLWYSPRTADRERGIAKVVRLTDGGALSNSGMWPLTPMLLRQRDRIAERGLLLIMVDASRMPVVDAPNRQRDLLATILDKNPKGERLHLQMLEQLSNVYGGCFAAVEVNLPPVRRFNVYTTWALDTRSLRRVRDGFDEVWEQVGTGLDAIFNSLKSCRVDGPAPAAFPNRLPLS